MYPGSKHLNVIVISDFTWGSARNTSVVPPLSLTAGLPATCKNAV